MSDPYLIGMAVTACAAGMVSAATYLLAPVVHRARARRAAHAPARVVEVPVQAVDLTALIASGMAEAVEIHPCPKEQQQLQPHAVHADGSRSCWNCGHDISGDRR